jgi:hypothetical protein
MLHAGDRYTTIHRLRTLPISPPSSVIVASGSLRARRKLLEKRELQRFIIVVNSCTLTQSQTITIPTRTTIDPSRPLDYKLARIA